MKASKYLLASSSLATSSSHINSRILQQHYFSVEWSPKGVTSSIQSQLQPSVTHYVLPDLPTVFTDTDKNEFIDCTKPNERIHTIAACHHTNHKSIIQTISQVSSSKTYPEGKLYLSFDKNLDLFSQ